MFSCCPLNSSVLPDAWSLQHWTVAIFSLIYDLHKICCVRRIRLCIYFCWKNAVERGILNKHQRIILHKAWPWFWYARISIHPIIICFECVQLGVVFAFLWMRVCIDYDILIFVIQTNSLVWTHFRNRAMDDYAKLFACANIEHTKMREPNSQSTKYRLIYCITSQQFSLDWCCMIMICLVRFDDDFICAYIVHIYKTATIAWK